MRPFQEFRLWARRAPAGERVVTAVAAVVVVALLGWLVAPGGGGSATELASASGGATGGSANSSVTPGTQVGGAPGLASSSPGASGGARAGATRGGVASTTGGAGGTDIPGLTPGGSGTGPGAPRCVSPPGTATGVSAGRIKIAVTLTNIIGPAANSLFGIDTPAKQQAYFTAAINGLNKEGGVACRQLVPTFYAVNPVDQSDLHQKCLDMKASGAFAVIDGGEYSAVGSGPTCFITNKLPYFGGYFLTQKLSDQGYPYLFELALFDRLYTDAIYAFRDRGIFTPAKGFKKLGIIYRSCFSELIGEAVDALHKSGVPSSQIDTYDFSCPAAFASPSDIAQAVLQFQSHGVTDMTEVNDPGDLANFTSVAQQQGFKPHWVLPDDQVIGTAYGTSPPDKNNFANALAVTESRNGEERTPGMSPTSGTLRCDSYLKAAGLAPTYKQAPGAGNMCDELWMFKAALENAPELRQDAMAAGLAKVKSIDFSYPQGPNDFSGSRVTTAGQQWRTAQFYADCGCWKLIDRDFHPSYT
ncbi:MAG: type 1 periplasmic-binding domain-containing protein [Acidimicrobiales bacterium]